MTEAEEKIFDWFSTVAVLRGHHQEEFLAAVLGCPTEVARALERQLHTSQKQSTMLMADRAQRAADLYQLRLDPLTMVAHSTNFQVLKAYQEARAAGSAPLTALTEVAFKKPGGAS